jgi:hypothetical protein
MMQILWWMRQDMVDEVSAMVDEVNAMADK